MGPTKKEITKPCLVIISPGFPSNEKDESCLPAIQRFVLTINKTFPDLGVVIISLHYPSRCTYRWNGNTVHALGGARQKLLRPVLWIQAISLIRKVSREESVLGTLSMWCHDASLIGLRFARRNGIPGFCWIQGQDAREENRYVRWVAPTPDELVALSPFLASEFHFNHRVRPAHIVRNGINPELIAATVDSQTINVFGAGSLIPLKRYDIFIEIISELRKQFPYLRAELAGDGPERSRLEKQIQLFDLNETITLLGPLTPEAVLDKMRQSAIFLHPSSYEGYSTVCAEAMYCGCHVVSFTAPEEDLPSQWHVVQNVSEMRSVCAGLIGSGDRGESILLADLRTEIRKLIALFNYPDTTR